MNLPAAPNLADAVTDSLRDVIDPELGINVVDLGLIRSVTVENGVARIAMALTTPGCPIGSSLVAAVDHRATSTDGIDRAEVELVWHPPWSPAMLSPAAREILGLTPT